MVTTFHFVEVTFPNLFRWTNSFSFWTWSFGSFTETHRRHSEETLLWLWARPVAQCRFILSVQELREGGGGHRSQSSNEQPDAEPPHWDSGDPGDPPAHGHLRPKRILRGGSGAGGVRQEAGEETLLAPGHSGESDGRFFDMVFKMQTWKLRRVENGQTSAERLWFWKKKDFIQGVSPAVFWENL